LEWSDQGVEGSFRFLSRLWRICDEYLEDIKAVNPLPSGVGLEGELKVCGAKPIRLSAK